MIYAPADQSVSDSGGCGYLLSSKCSSINCSQIKYYCCPMPECVLCQLVRDVPMAFDEVQYVRSVFCLQFGCAHVYNIVLLIGSC